MDYVALSNHAHSLAGMKKADAIRKLSSIGVPNYEIHDSRASYNTANSALIKMLVIGGTVVEAKI